MKRKRRGARHPALHLDAPPALKPPGRTRFFSLHSTSHRMPSRKHSIAVPAVALVATMFVSAAHGDEHGADDGPGRWGLGLGAAYEKNPYRDEMAHLLPLLTYESSRLSLLGTRADLKLGSTGPCRSACACATRLVTATTRMIRQRCVAWKTALPIVLVIDRASDERIEPSR